MDEFLLNWYIKNKHKMEVHNNETNHFDKECALHTVAEMYHTKDNETYKGEMYSMEKAKEVHEKYKDSIPSDVTCPDIYVAINAQYHDYCELFNTWFDEYVDCKIIESAIVFWFKDEDYEKGTKIWNYFNK